MKVFLIWAQGLHGAIGVRNTLPWHIPEDLKAFKELTLGKPVLMGRNTWHSLPFRPLPKRPNVVISTTMGEIEGARVSQSLERALELLRDEGHPEIFVIGGAQVYAAALDHADEVWVTFVDLHAPDADTFMPALDGATWVATETRNLAANATQTRFVRHADRPKKRICQACHKCSFFKKSLAPVMRHQDRDVAFSGWGLDRVTWVCPECNERHH